jgi:YHS domain-containing protein
MATINSTVEVAGVGTYDFYFSSSENKDLFDSDPWKFALKYGGF